MNLEICPLVQMLHLLFQLFTFLIILHRRSSRVLRCVLFLQFAEQYCEDDIGDLSHEEIEGFIRPDSERVDMLVSQFEKQNQKMFVFFNLI